MFGSERTQSRSRSSPRTGPHARTLRRSYHDSTGFAESADAVCLRPDYVEARYTLGLTCVATRDLAGARDQNRELMKLYKEMARKT